LEKVICLYNYYGIKLFIIGKCGICRKYSPPRIAQKLYALLDLWWNINENISYIFTLYSIVLNSEVKFMSILRVWNDHNFCLFHLAILLSWF